MHKEIIVASATNKRHTSKRNETKLNWIERKKKKYSKIIVYDGKRLWATNL